MDRVETNLRHSDSIRMNTEGLLILFMFCELQTRLQCLIARNCTTRTVQLLEYTCCKNWNYLKHCDSIRLNIFQACFIYYASIRMNTFQAYLRYYEIIRLNKFQAYLRYYDSIRLNKFQAYLRTVTTFGRTHFRLI
jgi:hypothetical protein